MDVSALCTETRPETGTPPSSWQDCARRLATAVSAYFTGPFPSHTLFESEAKAIMKARDVGYLPLSCLHIGLTRHRAMVFKACCDRLGLPCQLHRTRIDGRICSWTLLLADGQAHFCDLTYFPGYLVPAFLWPAYLRLEHTPPVRVRSRQICRLVTANSVPGVLQCMVRFCFALSQQGCISDIICLRCEIRSKCVS